MGAATFALSQRNSEAASPHRERAVYLARSRITLTAQDPGIEEDSNPNTTHGMNDLQLVIRLQAGAIPNVSARAHRSQHSLLPG